MKTSMVTLLNWLRNELNSSAGGMPEPTSVVKACWTVLRNTSKNYGGQAAYIVG